MKPIDFPLLADENIHPDVVAGLLARGRDIVSVAQEGLTGGADATVLRHAHAAGRVVLTHDADFGTLALRDGEPVIGVIYLRPGHIRAEFVLETIAAVESLDVDVQPPFIIVAERKEDTVRVRLRHL